MLARANIETWYKVCANIRKYNIGTTPEFRAMIEYLVQDGLPAEAFDQHDPESYECL